MSITISIGHESYARSRGFVDLFVFFSRLTGVRIIVFGHPQRHGCFHVFFHFRWQMAGKLKSHWSDSTSKWPYLWVIHAMLWKASIRKETWAFFSSLPAEAQQQHQPWWFVIPEVCGKNAKKPLGLDPLVLDKPMDVEDQH